MKILIVEDEPKLRETIVQFLEKEGFVCEVAENLKAGSEKLYVYHYDCLLLDIGLPDGNGLMLIHEIKRIHPETGIIIISAKNSLDDKINGLDAGADDYMAKPFHLTELNSRIKSLLRRRIFDGKKVISYGSIVIYPDTRQVEVGKEVVVLTKKEYDLLEYFVSNPDRVLTKEAIVEHLWGDFADSADSFDFVYSHMKNLRRKIMEKSGTDHFRNIYGTGYIFSAVSS